MDRRRQVAAPKDRGCTGKICKFIPRYFCQRKNLCRNDQIRTNLVGTGVLDGPRANDFCLDMVRRRTLLYAIDFLSARTVGDAGPYRFVGNRSFLHQILIYLSRRGKSLKFFSHKRRDWERRLGAAGPYRFVGAFVSTYKISVPKVSEYNLHILCTGRPTTLK